MKKTGTIEFYSSTNSEIPLDVRLESETVWLSLEQISELFDKNKSTISRHIKNIFSEGELIDDAVVANFATTALDGKTYQVDHYNLDVIISVGYRVKSKKGTQFRIWASGILKEYAQKGYAVNAVKLEQKGKDMDALLSLLEDTVDNRDLDLLETKEMISIVKKYAKTFSLLQEYDEDKLTESRHEVSKVELEIEQSRDALAKLKQELIQKGEATNLFGKERDNAFAAIIGCIEQTYCNRTVRVDKGLG